MKWFLSLFFTSVCAFAFDSNLSSNINANFEVENTNIFSSSEGSKSSDYNRLRLYSTLQNSNYEKVLFKMILDNYNTYTNENNHDNNTNRTKIYRGYLDYSDKQQILTIGKQRIPYGIGRIWNPIDIYNPIDATAIESDEREGVESVRYEYAINALSSVDATLSKNKYALRTKGYLDVADVAMVVLKDTKEDKTIIGYEIQGELGESGLELRSEGGHFINHNSKNYDEYILGAEYGFENSLNILGEYKYNSLNHQDYLALNLSYTLTPLWRCNYLGIQNLDDESTLSIARFIYSLSDESELDFGTFVYTGKATSEYGQLDNSLFLRYFIHF